MELECNMSKAGTRILQGALDALAFARGTADISNYRVHIPADIDVKAIRGKLGLSQVDFAKRYGFSVGRVRDWERKRREVDASSGLLLMAIATEPEAVARKRQP